MDERLNNTLAEGEKVLWRSRPQAFEIMDKTHKTVYTRTGIIYLIATLAITALYIYMAITREAGIKYGVVVVFALIGLYLIISPFLDSRRIASKFEYILTNQHLMILSHSDIVSVALDNFSGCRLMEDADGHTSLLCGEEALSLKPHQLRSATVSGSRINQDTLLCESLVMYAIDDVAGFKKAADGLLSLS